MSEPSCRNPGCACASSRASEYCSSACARAATGAIGPGTCDCGHPACRRPRPAASDGAEDERGSRGSEHCPHANCGCARADGPSPYCGSYCLNAAEVESLPGEADLAGACACGHETCRAGALGRSEAEAVTSTGRG